MAKFKKPAIRIIQGKRSLFLTSFTIKDFITENFYCVDRLDVDEDEGKQRILNEPRARSFGNDMVGADKHNEAFLPTSIFLATEGKINYDENTREMSFDSAAFEGVCPFDVVDGQHRIEGLKCAIFGEFFPPSLEGRWVAPPAPKHEDLLDFPVSVVVADRMSGPEKMLQFVTVNTKQEKVERGVHQAIVSRFTDMHQVTPLPYLPLWLRREVEKGDTSDALKIAKELNRNDRSPWHGRIRFIDNPERYPRHSINQSTFVTSVSSHLLARNHPLQSMRSDKQLPILINFWIAVERVFVARSDDFDAGAKSVVFKATGLEFFHSISSPVINRLAGRKEYTPDAFEECLRSAEPHLGNEAGIMLPEYWQRGGIASNLNRGGATKLAAIFATALADADEDDIKV